LRMHYSGNARTVLHRALVYDSKAENFQTIDPWEGPDPLADLKKQGWELWTKGNLFDDETLTFRFHLHKKPDPKKPGEDYPHRYYRVASTFKGGKFVPGKPVRDPQGQ
jgi:hypothetical protein